MRANNELTPRDFEISFQLKLAMREFTNGGDGKENVLAALRILHEG